MSLGMGKKKTAAAVRERALGEILLEQGVIGPLQLDEALQRQRLTGDMLGRVLVNMGYCTEQDVIEGLGVQSGMERVDLTKMKINETIIASGYPHLEEAYKVAELLFPELGINQAPRLTHGTAPGEFGVGAFRPRVAAE